MDASLVAPQVFREVIDGLRHGEHQRGIAQDGFPVLGQVVSAQLLPAQHQQHHHDQHHHEHLPPQPDHQDLQRDHQQDGIQVVEDGEHLDFPVDPARAQPEGGEHREEDTRRGRGRKTTQEQVFLPRLGAAPQLRRQQHQHIIDGNDDPGHRSRGHRNEIVPGIGFPARLVDLELPSDVDHDKAETNVEQRIRNGLEFGVVGSENARKQLRSDEPEDQEQGKGEHFSHRIRDIFGYERSKVNFFRQNPK